MTAIARGDNDDDDDDDGEVDSKRLMVYRRHVDLPTPLAPQITVRIPDELHCIPRGYVSGIKWVY